jgi:hypothetical protein
VAPSDQPGMAPAVQVPHLWSYPFQRSLRGLLQGAPYLPSWRICRPGMRHAFCSLAPHRPCCSMLGCLHVCSWLRGMSNSGPDLPSLLIYMRFHACLPSLGPQCLGMPPFEDTNPPQ